MDEKSLRARIDRVKELGSKYNIAIAASYYQEAISIIQALEAKLEVAREALKFYRFYANNLQAVGDKCKQALERIDLD